MASESAERAAPRRDPRIFSAIVIGGSGVLLAGLVAATPGGWSTRSSATSAGVPTWLLDVLASAVAVGAVFGAIVVVAFFWPGRRRKADDADGARQVPWWIKAVAVFLLLLLLALVMTLLRQDPERESTRGDRTHAAQEAPAGEADDAPDSGGSGIDWWIVALSVVVACVAIVAYAIATRRRLRSEVDPTTDHRAVIAEAADESLARLRAEPDPRRAVIAAFAWMERLLERAGWARRRSEAPFEYVDRVLVEAGAGTQASSTLAALFERAEFAPHPVGPEMKDAAIDALVDLRDGMRDPQ